MEPNTYKTDFSYFVRMAVKNDMPWKTEIDNCKIQMISLVSSSVGAKSFSSESSVFHGILFFKVNLTKCEKSGIKSLSTSKSILDVT